MNPVSVIFKYLSSFNTSGDNMKKRSRSIYSQFSKHSSRISLKEKHLNGFYKIILCRSKAFKIIFDKVIRKEYEYQMVYNIYQRIG